MLKPNDCTDLFGSTAVIFSSTQTYKGQTCTGRFAGLGKMGQDFCHSDTWNGATPATCDVKNLGNPKNGGTGVVVNQLTVDTEYQPTVNPVCNPNNSGIVNLTVFAVNRDTSHPNNNTVALEEINQTSITVNGNHVRTKSDGTLDCSFDVFPSPNVMTCNINKCEGGHNILAGKITGNGNKQTATLTFSAQMSDQKTQVTGDVETVNVSTSVP